MYIATYIRQFENVIVSVLILTQLLLKFLRNDNSGYNINLQFVLFSSFILQPASTL